MGENKKEMDTKPLQNHVGKTVSGRSIIAAIILIICIAAAVIAIKVILPAVNYAKAEKALNKGNVNEAYERFSALEGYKDSEAMAAMLFEQENTRRINNPRVGDTVFFGHYEQDNNIDTGKESIEWQVLDVQDGKALLISKYALDCQPYNNTWEDTSWDKCSLRIWLNETFLNNAFTLDDQERILISDVYADRNPKYGTDQGTAAKDKVFLVSIAEVGAYMSSGSVLDCAQTKYVEALGVPGIRRRDGEFSCQWWLRTMGEDRRSVTVIKPLGFVDCQGDSVIDEKKAIRPAIRIKLETQGK